MSAIRTGTRTTIAETNLPDPSLLPAIANDTAGSYNTLVPYLGFHSIRLSETVQNSHYNGFQTEFRSQVRRDLTLQAAYTLSRAIDPATNANGVGDLTNVSNPYSYTYDDGPSGLDRTHIFFVNFIYDLPIFRNSSSRLLKSTIGGWQVSGIVTAVSGNPLNITEGGATGNISNKIPNTNNRPDLVGSISTPHAVNEWVYKSGFADPAPGSWATAPFDAVRGTWPPELERRALQELRDQRVSWQPYRVPGRELQHLEPYPVQQRKYDFLGWRFRPRHDRS